MTVKFIALLILWTLTSPSTSYLSKRDKCPIPRICEWGCDYQRKMMYCTESMLGPYSPELLDLHDNNSWAIDFSLNLIIIIQNKSFFVSYDEVLRVHSLNYSFNDIVTVENGAFMGLENELHTLILDHNRLKALHAGALLGLRKLMTLTLSHNLLTTLDFIGQGGFSQLSHLDMSYNDLMELSSTAFHGLHFGQNRNFTLNLEGNELRYIDACTFQGRQLLSLKLMNNSLMCLCDMAWLPGYMTTQENDDIQCVIPTSTGNGSWSTIASFANTHCKQLNLEHIQCESVPNVTATLDDRNSSELILNLPSNQTSAELKVTLYGFDGDSPSQLGHYEFKDKHLSQQYSIQLPEMTAREMMVCILLAGNTDSKEEITHCQQVKLPVPNLNVSSVRSDASLTTAYGCLTTLTFLTTMLR